jgi:hypothetical protein
MSKKYTPAEAAMAVLAKVQELHGMSSLAKAETGHERGVNLSSKRSGPGVSTMGSHIRNAAGVDPAGGTFSPSPRDVDDSKYAAKSAAKRTLMHSRAMPKPNIPEPMAKDDMSAPPPPPSPTINDQIGNPFGKAETPMKGHIKLAKFMGRMEAKRGQIDKAETGHEAGIATKPNPQSKEGVSTGGAMARLGDTGAAKQQSIGRMMQSSKIKPNLP